MRKVEVNSLIKTTPSKIISAFTEPEMLREWWAVERSLIEKKKGGIYSLAWNISDKGFGYIFSGIIKNYNPRSILEIENFIYLNPQRPILGPMTLTIHADGHDGASTFYLCQDGYQHGPDWDWYYEAVCEAWPEVTHTLKTYLEKNNHG